MMGEIKEHSSRSPYTGASINFGGLGREQETESLLQEITTGVAS